jgi:DNA processing protein
VRTGAAARPPWWAPGLDERAVLLGLAATPGPLPSVTAARLAAGQAPADLLRTDSPDPAEVADRLDAIGGRFLTPLDPDWPFTHQAPFGPSHTGSTPRGVLGPFGPSHTGSTHRDVLGPDPPCAWLFVAGGALPPPARSVAVVGGRRATPLRLAVAESMAAALALAGWAVVSGGAVGVDAAAHRGALAGGGRTVAVLGCGLDVAYPRPNQALLARLRAAGGAVVTEHPPGARPRPEHFRPRNRLIAALAAAVVVVEAAEASGSLSTAHAAGSRGSGRVLVVPGAPWDPGAAGCNELIRDGAVLVRGVDDVLAELGDAAPDAAGRGGQPRTGRAGQPAPGSAAALVLGVLIDGLPVPMRSIATLTGLAPDRLARAVTELELRGLARRSATGVQSLGTNR